MANFISNNQACQGNYNLQSATSIYFSTFQNMVDLMAAVNEAPREEGARIIQYWISSRAIRLHPFAIKISTYLSAEPKNVKHRPSYIGT